MPVRYSFTAGTIKSHCSTFHCIVASPENGTMHEFSCDNSDPLTDFFFDFNDVPRLVSYNVTCTKNG